MDVRRIAERTIIETPVMTRREYTYRVADFWMSISLPESWDVAQLLPTFRPFLKDMGNADTLLLQCHVVPVPQVQLPDDMGEMIEQTTNDMGVIRLYWHAEGYRVVLSVDGSNHQHTMLASKDFSKLTVWLSTQDSAMGHMLSSFLRLAYSQAILSHDAVAIHASAVYHQGSAYLFMAESGTGKSTHSALWMQHIPGTALLNDDNPTVRIVDNIAWAWGTPWSGKTPCYKDMSFPIGGMVRLSQATVNSFSMQEGIGAFVAIFPGCSLISQDNVLRSLLYDTVSRLAELATVGLLQCRPDAEAAILCHSALTAVAN